LAAQAAPAARAAAVSADSAARARVPEEPAGPVPALVLAPAQVPVVLVVPALLRQSLERAVPADLLVRVLPVPADLRLAVVSAAAPEEVLLSRQSFSTAMARTTP
jgi:hypothetical protein